MGINTESKSRIKNVLKKKLPILNWLPKYNISNGLHDLLAGFTVGLTEVPQSIAYASVAGLPPEYGLYSGFMGCFVYTLFGTTKDVNIGPTAIMALMIQSAVEQMGPEVAILTAFLSGCIILILGLLRLGFIVEFFSYPVVAGFTCAASLQIAASQLSNLLGIKGKGNEFLESIITVIEHIDEVNKWDLTLGLCCIAALIIIKELKRCVSSMERSSRLWNALKKFVWFTSLASNAILVIFGGLLAYLLLENGKEPFTLIDEVNGGLPDFQAPPFSIHFNGTKFEFMDIVQNLGANLVFVPLVAILESIAVAKSFSKGKSLDATQEMLALGFCNLMGSFVGSMPVTGSFTRSAVNNASGVTTPAGGAITGTVVLLALALLTSTFAYIPKTVLAAVVITAMIYLFDYEAIVFFWKTKKLDLIPFTVTFVASLFLGLEYGILIGITIHLVYVLYPVARPKFNFENQYIGEIGAIFIAPGPDMQFPVAEYFCNKLLKQNDIEEQAVVVIDGKKIIYMDSTVACNLQNLVKELEKRNRQIVLWNFLPAIEKVCVAGDNTLSKYFHSGPLENIGMQT